MVLDTRASHCGLTEIISSVLYDITLIWVSDRV
jgi:hypothetical protein